jgi:hypothetical protein
MDATIDQQTAELAAWTRDVKESGESAVGNAIRDVPSLAEQPVSTELPGAE